MLTSKDMLKFLSNQLSSEEIRYFEHHPRQLLRKLDGATTEATVLFSDLVSFTKFSEEHNLEKVRLLIKTTLPPIAGEIRQAGGAVDKYIGDAIMAIFGAPEYPRHELDLVVWAAFRMHERIDQCERELNVLGINPQKIKVGICTGEIVFVRLEDNGHDELTILGKTVNRAARLSTLSEEQRVFIDERTYERLSPTMRENCLERKPFNKRGCKFYYYPLEHWSSYFIPGRLIKFENDNH